MSSTNLTNRINVSGHIGDAGAAYTITDNDADTQITLTNGTISQTLNFTEVDDDSSDTNTLNFDKLGVKITLDSTYDAASDDLDGLDFTVGSQAQKVQVGARNEIYDQIAVSMADMNTDTTWGEAGDAMDNWGISSVTEAQNALNSIDAAITYVTTKRGDLGAYQNRLSYAAANLSTTIENTSAAESTVRDVDMAAEMTLFTKNQILMQAGTAMLAQANIAPQQALSLFG
jgi:flagellin